MPFIAFIGGIARALVGSGHWSRGIAYPITAAICAYIGFGLTWWALAFGIVAAGNVWLGTDDWDDRAYMLVRYGAVPLILTAAFMYFGGPWETLLWPLACGLVGLMYKSILTAFRRVNWWIVDSTRIAEFIAGTVIIGGLAVF